MKDIKKTVLALLVVAILITACVPYGGSVKGEKLETEDGFKYEVIELEGMTCIWIVRSVMAEYAYAGLTCDWREYTGDR